MDAAPAPRAIPLYPISEYVSETAPEEPFVLGRFEESRSRPDGPWKHDFQSLLEELPEFDSAAIEFSMLNKINQ